MNKKRNIKGVKFSNKEKTRENSDLQSLYDKRINDLLHIIEFKIINQMKHIKLS